MIFCVFFSNSTFWNNSFRNSSSVSNPLDPDQADRAFPAPSVQSNQSLFEEHGGSLEETL